MSNTPVSSYILTKHAAEQIELRFGFTGDAATRWANEQMAAATFEKKSHREDGRINDVFKAPGVRIVVDGTKIVTVKPIAVETTSLAGEINAYVRKYLQRAHREYVRIERVLSIESAELGVELAQLVLNYAKAKSPKTRASIDAKRAELTAKIEAVNLELKRAADRYENERRSASAYGAEAAR